MEIKINGSPYQVPTDLSQITLSQFIKYYDNHGRELDKVLKEILEKEYEDEFDREVDIMQHEDREAICWFSFWTGLDFAGITDDDATDLSILYRKIRVLLLDSEEQSYKLPADIEWEGETWHIQDFKVTPTSSFTFNELITSKEVMRQVHSIGKGRWDAMPYLCAVFFRKKGEEFSDSMVAEGSDRLALMMTLPMDHAIRVAFFLTVSVTIWKKALAFSRVREALN